MSRIFKAFEKAWEARHSAPLAVEQEAARESVTYHVPAPRSGCGPSNGNTPSENGKPGGAVFADSVATVRIRLTSGAPVLPFDGSDPRAAEQYKIVRTRILQHSAQPRCLVVSSAQTEDGKSINAVNIAGCMALTDQARVLLVDADLRRSELAETLGVPASPGLADVLAGSATLEKAVVRLGPFPNLYFLPRGERHGSPTELLDSGRWRTIAAVLKREFGFVVIDAPPIGLVADYDLVQEVADGVVLIVRPDHTNRTLGLKAIESVPPAQLIGVVINCASEWFLTKPLGQSYYEYYGEKS
ncbi:MAG TPA: CpsD/CapB family tyrosine-protein kinase [Bryobacteraceae bacterium]|nr:CpsD/CapB family tyrosine-protein kinase [Bryobacteraceae bacterium]